MNRKNVLEWLLSYLGEFRYHSDLLAELSDILQGSGCEQAFFKLLIVRLHMLSCKGKNAITDCPDHFERLLYNGGEVFSIILKRTGQFNIRILYSFLPSHEPVLLHAFYERSGKSKTNYSTHIPVALARLEDERRDYENEPFRV